MKTKYPLAFTGKKHMQIHIKANGHNPRSHKQAIFNSLTHRLVNIPLSIAEYKAEYNKIIEIAHTNGFPKSIVDKKLAVAKKKKAIKETTTLIAAETKRTFKKFTYHPWTFDKFKKIFKQYNIQLAPVNHYSIKNLVNSNTKDVILTKKKSGIYQIECSDCNEVYIGKTKRNLETRTKEHFRNIKYKQLDKSAVATHFWTRNHNINPEPKLLKNIAGYQELAIWEQIFIQKNKHRVFNFDIPQSDIFSKFLEPPPERTPTTTSPSSPQATSRYPVDDGGN